MVVVIVLVKPRMLPPTKITAPTSETVRPNPARTAVTRSALNDHEDLWNSLQSRRPIARQFVTVATPSPLAGSVHERCNDRDG